MGLTGASPVISLLLRWGGVVALALFAGIVAVSGVDRIAGSDPGSMGISGWAYDTFSARSRAVALLPGAPRQAEDYAVRAVRSDPLDSVPIGQLGLARLMAGDQAGAEAAFRVSGGLGWRDNTTQLYWFSQAMKQGDVLVAAQRLDALLRQMPTFPQRNNLIGTLLAYDEGRQAMAGRLAEGPPWATIFASNTADLPVQDLAGRADVVLRAPPGVLACKDIGGLVDSLLAADLVDQAQGVWHRSCSTDNGLLYDGGFRQLDTTAQTQALDWQLPARGDVDILNTQRDDGVRELRFKVMAASTLAVLRQAVVLGQGSYRVSWSMPGADEQALKAFKVSLACTPDQSLAIGGSRQGDGDRYFADFALDDTCKVRTLAFWLAPGPMVQISDITLVRLR